MYAYQRSWIHKKHRSRVLSLLPIPTPESLDFDFPKIKILQVYLWEIQGTGITKKTSIN
jgi:hypothetical protein